MSMFTQKVGWFAAVLALIGVVGLAGCGTEAGGDDGRVKVVATTTMIADLARQLGGEDINLVAIMRPGEDPHIYDVKPNDATQVREADLVLMNGVHLEATLGDIVENKAKGKVVALAEVQGIDLLKGEGTEAAADPHCWMDVKQYRRYAEAARDALIEVDPANAENYRKRAEAYLAELDALDAWVREQFAAVPAEQRVIVTSHDAFGYFGRAYGIEVHGVIGISTEQQPKPQDIQALEALVTERGVRGLFIESSTGPQLNDIIKRVAEKTGAKVGGTLFSDSLGEPGTAGGTYIGMIRHNTTTIVNAVK